MFYVHSDVILALMVKVKVKVNVHPKIDHEVPEGEWRYSSTLSLTSALGGVGGQHTPAALPPERHGNRCIGGWVGPRAGLDLALMV